MGIFFVYLMAANTGCVTLYNPATEKKEIILINTATEIAIGKSVDKQLRQEEKILSGTAQEQRVRNIGVKLAGISDRKDVQYEFSVIDEKELNAMSLPGGFVYVNKGLTDVMDDAELAYVLGHEIAHVAARHAVKKIQASMAYDLLLNIASAALSNNLAAAQTSQTIAKGVNTVYNLIALGYSRQDEYEADRLGAKYALKSGFNPEAAFSALEKIQKGEGPNWKIFGYFRTHPYADDRVKALKKYIPELKLKEKK